MAQRYGVTVDGRVAIGKGPFMHHLSCFRRLLTAGVVLAAAAGMLPLVSTAAAAAAVPPASATDPPNLGTPAVAYGYTTPQSATGVAMGVAARGTNGALLYSARSGNGFAPFQSLGGVIVGDPSAVVVPNGVQLFVRGTDDRVYTNTVTTSGAVTGYSVVPGLTVTGEVESIRLGAESGVAVKIQIFARGPDGAVWTNIQRDGAWAGWTSLGGFITSEITIIRWLSITSILVRGSDNRVYRYNFAPAAGFQALEGLRIIGNIGVCEACIINGAQIFVRGEDNRIYTRFPAPGEPWKTINGVFATSDITATNQALYVRGPDNHIYTSRSNQPFERVEGQVTSNPAAFTLQPGFLLDEYLLARQPNGALAFNIRPLGSPGGPWGGYTPIAGPTVD